MSDWKEYNLRDLVICNNESVDKNYPYSKIIYLDTGSITENKIDGLQEFDLNDAPSRAKRLVKENDIIYSTVRPNQLHYGFIENPPNNLVISTGFVTITCKVDTLYPRYLYYNLIQKQTTEYLHSIAEASTSAYPSLKPSDIKALEISLPPLPEQKAIASILSSLDDKIELLHRQNETLEKMTETLFRKWFVEKAEEDWEEGAISDIAFHSKESINPQNLHSKLFVHYSLPSFDSAKEPIKELGSEIRSSKYKVPQYCILFSKLNPHKDKRIWLLLDNIDDNAICSTEFQIVKPKNKKYLYFILGWLSYNDNYNEIASGVGGTSGSHQRINPSTIFDFNCPIVPINYIDKYNCVIQPIFEKINKNRTQIITITRLRDSLLPRLMSGEIRVS